MHIKTIAELKKTNYNFVNEQVAGLFDIYYVNIRPYIKEQVLKYEQYRAFFKPIIQVKNEEKSLLINNFELYCLLKNSNVDQETLKVNVIVGNIRLEEFSIGIPFYELIDFITRYKSAINLETIYIKLNDLLNPELNQQLFRKNKFAISTFCRLIGITEQSYHARVK